MKQESTTPDLSNAETPEQIINAVATAIWRKQNKKGEPPIPTPDDLIEIKNDNITTEVWKNFDQVWKELDKREQELWEELNKMGLESIQRALKQHSLAEMNDQLPNLIDKYQTEEEKQQRALYQKYSTCKFRLFMGYKDLSEDSETGILHIHEGWQLARKSNTKLKHPLAPIIRAWLSEQVPTVEIEKRQKQIAPAFLKQSKTSAKGKLPTGFLHKQGEETQLQLPNFENTDDDVVVHALPLEIYQGQKGGGRGAPLDERIFFNALLARPYGVKEPTGGVKIEPTLRDFVDWLYPNGWNKTNQLPILRKALYDVHNRRISYERREWSIVQVLALPEEITELDDLLPMVIRYPDGIEGHGPMIDVPRLRQYGLESAPKWRAWIRLHYLWDTAKQKNGGHPIYATRPEVMRNKQGYITRANGEVITSGDIYRTKKGKRRAKAGNIPRNEWHHPEAISTGHERNPTCDKIPVLTDEQLVMLFYDGREVDQATMRRRKSDSIKSLLDMEEDGVIVVEKDAIDENRGVKGWRILPVYQD